MLQNQIIVVSGQLVNRSAIKQYSSNLAQTVADVPGEWLLADHPPHAMVTANTEFDGGLVSLTTEEGFGPVFRSCLPFHTAIGWYPYCRITGFLNQPGYGQSIPSLSLIMAEFKPPKPFITESRKIFELLESELENPIYFGHRSDLILASYLLPIIATNAKVVVLEADDRQKQILQAYLGAVKSNLPSALSDWYQKALA